jgi:hypothetical protein
MSFDSLLSTPLLVTGILFPGERKERDKGGGMSEVSLNCDPHMRGGFIATLHLFWDDLLLLKLPRYFLYYISCFINLDVVRRGVFFTVIKTSLLDCIAPVSEKYILICNMARGEVLEIWTTARDPRLRIFTLSLPDLPREGFDPGSLDAFCLFCARALPTRTVRKATGR